MNTETKKVYPELFTHNGRFTIQNRESGQHRTFKVSTKAPDSDFAPGRRVVGLLTGPDNEESYTGFGFVNEDHIQVWSSKRGKAGAKSAFDHYADMLFSLVVDGGFSPYAEKYTLLEETVCRVCNRPLTTPESIKSGIGPICAERAAMAILG